MKHIMTYETLRRYTYSNDDKIKGKIKGIVLTFLGLGYSGMISESPDGLEYAEQGIVYLVPYYNPWCWMNAQAVEYVDEILDVLFAHYGLDAQTPIVSTGISMG